MIRHPFSSLRHFQDRIDLRLLTREDDAWNDDVIARTVGSVAVVGLKQMHGNRAVRVSTPSSRVIEADALATDVPGLTLGIRFADCQNAVIIAPERNVVCLVHAGWRGVQSRVMTSAYALLKEEWSIDPADTFVGLGPALCLQCSDFTDPVTEVPELKQFIRGNSVDLRAALDAELASIGVPLPRIERLSGCTRCSPKTYFTYRGGDREKVKEGFVNCLTVSLRLA